MQSSSDLHCRVVFPVQPIRTLALYRPVALTVIQPVTPLAVTCVHITLCSTAHPCLPFQIPSLLSDDNKCLQAIRFSLLSNFHRFYPQTVIVCNFWGRYNAILELNVYSWTWTKVPIILEIAFRWLSYFGFLSSSSRTQVTAVWSFGDDGATNHHCQHRHGHQL